MMFSEKPVFKMYTKSDCPFCERARKIILKDLKSSLHLIDVTDRSDLRETIRTTTGHHTVPVIYIGEEFIGGCDDLVKIVKTREVWIKMLTEENRILREEISRLRRSL